MLFAGGVACVGTGAGALFGGAESRTVVPNPALRVAIIDRLNDVSMNSTAEIVSLSKQRRRSARTKCRLRTHAAKCACQSAAFPLCSKTTIIRKIHTTT
jgi:hypothetical protein